MKIFVYFRLAVVFKNAGLQKGDIVQTLIANNNLTMPIVLATALLGASASLGDPFLDVASVSNMLKLTKAKIIVCLPWTEELVQNAVKNVNSSPNIFCIGLGQKYANISSLMYEINSNDCPQPVQLDPEKEIAIIYWTSGTTGKNPIKRTFPLHFNFFLHLYAYPKEYAIHTKTFFNKMA